jgi:hypothetical protein
LAQLFRAFRLAIHPTKLLLAFCCVFGTYVTGRILDAVWAPSSKPVLIAAGEGVQSELGIFAAPSGGGRHATHEWIRQVGEGEHVQRVGAFKLLLDHARTTIDAGTSAVVHADFGALVEAVRSALMGFLWLMAMHPLYALIFLLASLAIWALFGGAVCRVAALHAARDERIGLRDALGFAKSKFPSFVAAPLMPVGIVILFGAMLFVGGLVGAIPAVGEVFAGVLFFLALIAGLIIAFVVIGAVAGFGLTFPTIAAEGSDAFDALSRSFSYVYQRPWRTALYIFVSTVYGAVCLLFVKLFVRLALWAVHTCVGVSMNWGAAYAHDGAASTTIPGKLNALWHGPALVGDTTFWGGFGPHQFAHLSWFAQLWFYLWIFTVVGFVGAFVVSFFYSASTLMYFLLRREVDATDLDDVYLEETPVAPPPPPAAPAAEKDDKGTDTSVPVVGGP